MVVGGLQLECVGVEGYWRIEAYGGELLGEEGVVGMGADVLAQFVVLDVVEVRHHVLYGAELCYEFLGGLLPYPAYAGYVVDGVAPEAEEVDDLRGLCHVESLAYIGWTQDGVGCFAASVAVHCDARGYELGEVFVGGHHEHLVEACEFGGMGEGAYDVVGLESLTGELRDAEGVDDAAYPREVGLNVLGHGVAVGLVLGVYLVTECGRREVEGDAYMCGAL